MKPNSPLEQVGATIANRYRVEQVLGRGGMAVVYRVRDQRSGAELALKRSIAGDPRKRQRHDTLLEREFHTLAQLAHPRIIAVYDYGIDRAGNYYTMELLDGTDLEKVERMPWQRACALLCDVASSLAILHSRGLVHRDVSMRNVQCTTDGRAKLIDFGAMMSMGVAKDVVGTPPFMAPEALQLQALDGRADLFALGALAYRLLTGRHAFAAKRFRDLRDAWRSRPTPPALLVPEVPPELSALTLQLLTIDRAGRPHSAAEVIERLRPIADLQLEDGPDVSRAYLTTPALVGRDAALLRAHKRVLGLVRGDGGLLLIHGEAGAGRSRMLDACALQGKLLGTAVVRADARDSSGGEWGVVRALAAQLLTEFPQQAADAARLSRNVLSHVVEELRGSDEVHTATGYAPERSVLIRELRDWVLSLSKSQRLLIVVDDADRIDDPSAALLCALANKAERYAILLALAVSPHGQNDSSPALRLLEDVADTVELEHLQALETEALIRSLFGDVPNLPLCAARIHGLSHGNPRATMELCQHLVDTGRARYEAGSWVLPAQLDETDLPTTLAASLAARLTELSVDARELVDALTLADADALRVALYPALTEHRQIKRVFQALDELVAARILSADSERYTFTQRGFLAVLRDCMTPARRAELHVRIARVLAQTGGDLVRRADHLLAAGADAEGIDLLCRLDLAAQQPSVALLTAAIERGERLALSATTLHRLRVGLVIHAPMAMDYDSFRRVVPVVLEQLERDTGLARYRELAHLPANERLAQALAQTQQAYEATPERDRVHTAFEAIRELARVSGAVAAMVSTTFDLDMLDALPDLEPLFPLSPSLAIVGSIVAAAKHWAPGRLIKAREIYLAILLRIREPDRAGLDDSSFQRIHLGIEYSLGLLEALWGSDAAEARARLLESQRELRINAWRIRALTELARGNSAEWRKCSRRAQLLTAQEGLRERYVGSTVGMELTLQYRLGDMLAVKGVLGPIAALAARHPGWRSVECLGRAAYCELSGNLEGALEALASAFALAPAHRLPFYSTLAECHLSVLLLLDRVGEAAQWTLKYAAHCEQYGLLGVDVFRHGALALARNGDRQAALDMHANCLARAERIGCSAYALGVVLEAGARIAIELQDSAQFDGYVARCAREYEKAQNPIVSAKLERLVELARERGLGVGAETLALAQSQPLSQFDESEFETIHGRIAECIDSSDRGRCALTLLLQDTLSSIGFLYTADEAQALTLLAALPDPPDDPGLVHWLAAFASECLGSEEMEEATVSGAGDSTQTGGSDPLAQRYVDREGRSFQAIPLIGDHVSPRVLAGLLVVHVRANDHVSLRRQLTSSIARELIDYGDAKL
jgi:hypothetical protein